MHKLERPEPLDELTKAKKAYKGTIPPEEAWKNFGKDGSRTKVRKQLESVQNDLCAYCENSLENDGHIDHFKPKVDWKVTFEWNNLVVSCTHNDSCGGKKSKHYEDYWINPYEEDPKELFIFRTNGKIKGTTADANKIIEDFGLNSPRLKRKRGELLSFLTDEFLSDSDTLEYYKNMDYPMFPTAHKQIIEKISGE